MSHLFIFYFIIQNRLKDCFIFLFYNYLKDGRSFIIQHQSDFAKELLPLNYKHNNMASFIRQLNMYGFHKITSIDNGGLKFDKDEIEFSHPYFQKGMPGFLEHIKRKIANPKQSEEKNTGKVAAVNRVLNEVKTMRGRQVNSYENNEIGSANISEFQGYAGLKIFSYETRE